LPGSGMIGPVIRPLARVAFLLVLAVPAAGCSTLWPSYSDAARRSPSRPPVPPPGAEPTPFAPPPVTCGPSGVLVEPGGINAAMGTRVLKLSLVNCGKQPYRGNGSPVVRPLDEQGSTVELAIQAGANKVVTLVNVDDTPRAFTLRPGERATAVLAWHTRGPSVAVPYLEVTPAAGVPAQILSVGGVTDLAGADRAAISPWQK